MTWYVHERRYSVQCSLKIGHTQFPRPLYQELAVSQFLKTLPKGTFAGLFNP